jgi:MYXO-CTERM domain-containing protein
MRFATKLAWARRSFLSLALLGAAAPGDALAAQVFGSDCNFGVQDTFNPGDQVCVSGDVDVTPPGKIFPEGYLIVVPTGYAANPFADVTGAPNYVQGTAGGGAFFDQSVWLPPLKPGHYDLVINQYPFTGGFGVEDLRATGAITVTDAPLVYTCDPAAIKAAGMMGLAQAGALHNLTIYLALIDTLSTAADWAAAFGLGGAVAGLALGAFCFAAGVDCPTSYNSAVIAVGSRIINSLADSLALKYAAIVADPPDPMFLEVVALSFDDAIKAGAPFSPAVGQTVPVQQMAVAQALAVQLAAYGALRPTLEKLQGAQAAHDREGLLIQAEKLEAYASLAVAGGDRMLVELDTLEQYLAAQGTLATKVDVAPLVTPLGSSDFTDAEKNTLRSFGLTDQDIAMARSELLALPVPAEISWQAFLDGARNSYVSVKPALVDLASQAAQIRMENAPVALRLGPKAQVSGAAAGSVGKAMPLTASATHFDPTATLTYTWDTDGDGQFDDGSGTTLSHVPKAPGLQVVSVQVSDGTRRDVAFLTVQVAASNAPPELMGLSPADFAPFAAVGEVVPFHAAASDPDGDAVTLTWKVDGVAKGSGADFMFTMPDEEPHAVVVSAADTDAFTPDAEARFTVRAKKWIGGTGGSSSSTGSSSTGSSSSGVGGSGGGSAATGGGHVETGGGAGGDGSGSSAGCGCRVAPGPGSEGALLAAAAAFAAARRRRRRPASTRAGA